MQAVKNSMIRVHSKTRMSQSMGSKETETVEKIVNRSPKFFVTCLLFGESAVSGDVKSQVSSCQEIHDEVKVCPILERVDHVDKEAVFG